MQSEDTQNAEPEKHTDAPGNSSFETVSFAIGDYQAPIVSGAENSERTESNLYEDTPLFRSFEEASKRRCFLETLQDSISRKGYSGIPLEMLNLDEIILDRTIGVNQSSPPSTRLPLPSTLPKKINETKLPLKVEFIPYTKKRLKQIRKASRNDTSIRQVIIAWPNLPEEIRYIIIKLIQINMPLAR